MYAPERYQGALTRARVLTNILALLGIKFAYYDQGSYEAELGRRQVRVVIDAIALLWITIAFFEFVYLMGFMDVNLTLAVKGVVGFCLLVGGLALSSSPSMGVGMVLDVFISLDETITWFIDTFLSFCVILAMNAFVSKFSTLLAVSYISTEVFVMLIGIGEEASLRGWLLNLLSNYTGSNLVANVISSGIGATLHAGIYGARDIRVIVVVFASFMILGYIYSSSTRAVKGPFQEEVVPGRRISSIMTGHALVNLMALARRSMLGV